MRKNRLNKIKDNAMERNMEEKQETNPPSIEN